MNYPVWEAAATGGGLLIAIVAIIHVFAAHFAVGGGFFLVLTEQRARRQGDQALLAYVRGHTRFFLLITMVVGALTGVGIWLTISAVHPAATSVLIHTFVFAWAIEWVFFLVEIVSLLVYYYTFDRLKPDDHIKVGWIYAAAAWLSLFMIDAIISFMLTPGGWLEEPGFFRAFFNPSFWPSLFFRTALALTLAGIYGLITSSRLADEDLRRRQMRVCALWVAVPFLLLAPAAWWYFAAIPPQAQAMVLGRSPDVVAFAQAFLWIASLTILGGLALTLRLPRRAGQWAAVGLLVLGFLYMGSFEYLRETSRRPYVIHGYMYSNALTQAGTQATQQKGLLASARWSEIREITPANQEQAGRTLFRLACLNCHSLGGPRNDLRVQTAGMSRAKLEAVMAQMGHEKDYMPPFPGTAREAKVLAAFLRPEPLASR
jgi:cytochrome bd-type quinol oxidase subunit 1